ncbi:unnamed protein product [Soboliphyme baturini]|uniref:Orphan protein n=1 Tax=Soboliphyme baturini TaxID=241478 RepID=A0A183INP1_9BILA|nr:unnamed protein product [Soboliphyme baturini]
MTMHEIKYLSNADIFALLLSFFFVTTVQLRSGYSAFS